MCAGCTMITSWISSSVPAKVGKRWERECDVDLEKRSPAWDNFTKRVGGVDLFTSVRCLHLLWLVNRRKVGWSSRHIVRWSSYISDTIRILSQVIFGRWQQPHLKLFYRLLFTVYTVQGRRNSVSAVASDTSHNNSWIRITHLPEIACNKSILDSLSLYIILPGFC